MVRLRDRESKEVLIDLLKQRELYREVFKHTQMTSEAGQQFRIPSLEMALAMKYAAMISPNRPLEKGYQDAHDFIIMVKGNPEGQPSTTIPTDSPCDSPKMETRKILPKLFMKFYL